tara:strand:+ start:109 stop:711 length:603 start_codon:yes stop_codon:yes gene_type:complete
MKKAHIICEKCGSNSVVFKFEPPSPESAGVSLFCRCCSESTDVEEWNEFNHAVEFNPKCKSDIHNSPTLVKSLESENSTSTNINQADESASAWMIKQAAAISDGSIPEEEISVFIAARIISSALDGKDETIQSQIDEADRRAGAAERKYNSFMEERSRYQNLLRQRKLDAGYDNSVSFDKIWDDALKALKEKRARNGDDR